LKSIHRISQAVALVCALLAPGATTIANAAPSGTFSIDIGSSLLCLNQLNSKYFYDYLFIAFGRPYKADLGAFWFSTSRNRQSGTNLWGQQVSDILVNDGSSPADFLGAFFNVTPQALADAILLNTGFRFFPENSNERYSQLVSRTGSVIAYAGTKAKMYCAKSKFLVPSLR